MPLRGVGIDVVDVRRIARLLDGGGSFRTRWFTAAETARSDAAPSPAHAYARLLAAKEAAWKSLAVGWIRYVPWASMSVLERPGGWTLHLSGDIARAVEGSGGAVVDGSWTGDADVVLAIALAVRPA